MLCPWFVSVMCTDFPADIEMISFLVLPYTGTYGMKICLKNDLCPLSVFNLQKQVCASVIASGCPLLKLLSTILVSFTSCCDLDLHHSAICGQLLVDFNWGFRFRFDLKFLCSCFVLESVWLSTLSPSSPMSALSPNFGPIGFLAAFCFAFQGIAKYKIKLFSKQLLSISVHMTSTWV